MSILGQISAWLMETLAPYGAWGLMVMAICDSSFLSLPEINDLALMLFSINHPHRMWELAAMTTLGSVIGCTLLYLVGRKGGESLLKKRFSDDRIRKIQGWYQKYGMLAIIVPSLLPPPMPFKVFVLSAGAFHVPWSRFISAVAIGRGVRYFAEGILAVVYGRDAIRIVSENFGRIGLFLAILIVAGALGYIYFRRRSSRVYIVPLLLVGLLSMGCVKNRTLSQAQRMRESYPLTREQALKKLEDLSRAIKTLRTPVLLEASVGGQQKADVKDYPVLKGQLIFQSPERIRIQADYLTFTAFDMISDGNTYDVLVPHDNKLFQGKEQGPPVGRIFDNDIQNLVADLRPNQIKSALIVDILPYLNSENFKSVPSVIPMPQDQRRYFVMDFVDVSAADAQLVEKVWFDLSSPQLEISRRMMFGKDGSIEMDARFSEYHELPDSNLRFPSVIGIQFPDRDLALKVTLQDPDRVTLNMDLPPALFELPPHNGYDIVRLEPKPGGAAQ